MTPEQRVNELRKRQVWYGSSMVVKLNAINGKWWYSVFAWIKQDNVDTKILVNMNKYNGEDPEEMISACLNQLDLKKIKLGVPQ